MGDWLLMPAKVFLIGLLLAMITTFTWRSVEIPYVQQAAIVSAQTASTSSTPQATATSTVNSMIHSSANDMLTIGNNGMVTSTVSYQPPNIASNVFNYLGIPTPNQPIVMSSSAVAKNTGIQMQSVMPNLQLYTVSGAPTVANIVSGYEEEIIGTLAFAGTPIANADITLTTSGGTIGEATVNPTNGATSTIDGGSITLTAPSTSEVTSGIPSTTTLDLKTNAEGQFALDYYAPINIGQFSVTANGANATETVPISSTPVVTVGTIANTYVNGSTTISGNVQTSSGSPVQDEPVTLTITAPDTTSQQVNTTTDTSGNFSTTYTPVQLGGYMVKAECEGGTSNLYEQAVSLTTGNTTYQTNDPSVWLQSGMGGINAGATVWPNQSNNFNAGDYFQAVYNAPIGYVINEFVGGLSSDISSPPPNYGDTTIYLDALDNSQLLDTYPITNRASGVVPVSQPFPSGTISMGAGVSFGSSGTMGSWAESVISGSSAFVSPSGTTATGGVFGSQPVQINVIGFSCTPSASGCFLGDSSTVTGNVTYNGTSLANVPLSANIDWVDQQGIAQSTSPVQLTTDTGGNFTYTFTLPSTYTSGLYYMPTVWGDGGETQIGYIYTN